MEIGFAEPQYLWFLLSVPVLVIVHMVSLRYLRRRALLFANFKAVARVLGSSRDLSKNTLPFMLKTLALSCLTLAVAGLVVQEEVLRTDFDFVMALDASSSMLIDDYEPTRLEAAKEASLSFIDSLGETKTKVGVVEFGAVALTRVSPTDDMQRVRQGIQSIKFQAGGTAIGDALITSVNRLLSTDQAKAVILLTDGQNNVGTSPLEALELAVEEDVVIYTIGVGAPEGATFGNLTLVSKLDEETLKAMAQSTGGKYFRVDSETELYETFSQLATKSPSLEVIELRPHLLLAGLAILILEWVIINLRYRTIP